jgi:hypothetical protein
MHACLVELQRPRAASGAAIDHPVPCSSLKQLSKEAAFCENRLTDRYGSLYGYRDLSGPAGRNSADSYEDKKRDRRDIAFKNDTGRDSR